MQCNSTSKYKGRVLAVKIFLSVRRAASAAAPKMFLLSNNGRVGTKPPSPVLDLHNVTIVKWMSSKIRKTVKPNCCTILNPTAA